MPRAFVLALAIASATPAIAQSEEATTAAAIEDEAPRGRKFDFEFGLRVRRMTVPRGFMNIWHTDSSFERWPAEAGERPFINGWSYGGEFVIRGERSSAIVWVDWIDSSMGEGYWDDKDDAKDALNGDWLRPSNNLGLISAGADFQHEVPFVKPAKTRGIFGLGLTVGAGLGISYLIGDLQEWELGDDGTPAFQRVANGEPADSPSKKFNRVWPVVDVNLGLRFNFANRVSLRLEGGLHTMLFYGASLGFQF